MKIAIGVIIFILIYLAFICGVCASAGKGTGTDKKDEEQIEYINTWKESQNGRRKTDKN